VTADLAPLFGDGGFPKDYFIQSLVDGFTVSFGKDEGQVHGVPQSADAIITAYNTRHFEEAGLDAPSDDWTWEEFLDTAKKLQQKSGDRITRYGAYVDHNAPPLYNPIAQSYGGKVIEDDGSRFLLDSEPMLKTWHTLIDPRKEGVFSSIQASKAAGFGDLFNNGTASMQFTVRAAVPAMRSTVKTFDVATFPSVNGQRKTGAGAVGLAMTASADQAVTLDFLKWFFSEDGGMKILAASYSIVPPIPSLKNSDIWRSLTAPPANNEAFVKAFETGVLSPNIPPKAAGKLAAALSLAGEQVLLKGRSIEDAFAEANKTANAAL
jgi:ABC-type glycerol-3-phosphate transport system substrate-binding protein